MTILRWGVALLLALTSTSQASQKVLSDNNATATPGQHAFSDEANLFTPVETLSALSDVEFTTLRHPLFQRHSARIKKTDFCDPTVNGYTGYIDIGARHLFFYFFESRSSPEKDDVIFWTNGGPGCSSSLGLFMELGPCRVLDANGPKFHPESWNTNANIFFIDQPIGVGFSYAEYGEAVGTTEEAAKDIAAFVSIFFENFSQFKGRPFHMAGESYGGRYLPLFASGVYDQNAALVEAGLTPINLASVMIGNGLTHWYHMLPSYFDMSCTTTSASVPPIINISTCVAMKNGLGRCKKWTKESCIDQFDAIDCAAAFNFCVQLLYAPFLDTGMNPYDISSPCEGSMETLCYPVMNYINKYLSDPKVRETLGVDHNSLIPANFTVCNFDVGMAFEKTLDMLHESTAYIGALLERGVRVLIYVGTYDWICNWVGNEKWTLELEWSGQEQFVKQELRDWLIDKKRAGRTRSWGNFTFATVDAAGHMVPYDKPKESLELVKRWLTKGEL
ncbi:carboxypeptidase y precursor [Moniliophthora roreri]|nr:carboxypeptidase y precursor [Moniliophthora roreri]